MYTYPEIEKLSNSGSKIYSYVGFSDLLALLMEILKKYLYEIFLYREKDNLI